MKSTTVPSNTIRSFGWIILSHRDKLYVLSRQRDTETTMMETYCSYEKQMARVLNSPAVPETCDTHEPSTALVNTGELSETFEIEIADDIEQGLGHHHITVLQLRLRVLALTAQDVLEVTLNQKSLPFPAARHVLCHEGAARYRPPDECDYLGVGASTWLIWDLLTERN